MSESETYKNRTKEKLELIARFMGYEYYGWNSEFHRAKPEYTSGYWGLKGAKVHALKIQGSMLFNPLKYNSSWDWLMPVGKRCQDVTTAQDYPSMNHCSRLDWIECEIGIAIREYDLPITFEKIVEFVEMYNKTQSNAK